MASDPESQLLSLLYEMRRSIQRIEARVDELTIRVTSVQHKVGQLRSLLTGARDK